MFQQVARRATQGVFRSLLPDGPRGVTSLRVISSGLDADPSSDLKDKAYLYSTRFFSGSIDGGRDSVAKTGSGTDGTSRRWGMLKDKGIDINPCRSAFHPSRLEGIEIPEGEEVSIQEAYTPESECFGCGPSSDGGLHLRSYRIENGLEALVSIDKKFCAFPGIVNGGIISTLFDCQGNWTAAMALMDLGCLPNPPLTVVSEMLINYEEPTPPEEQLLISSTVVDIQESAKIGAKATVHVELTLKQRTPVGEKTIATGHGVFKKLGALRAL
jgi:acyl-coenzyme A thioesterase PaaI-like protein